MSETFSGNLHSFDEHALAVLEERNRAFRVIYDTVIQLAQTQTNSQEVYKIICQNIRDLSRASFSILFTCDSVRNVFDLKYGCSGDGNWKCFVPQGNGCVIDKSYFKSFDGLSIVRIEETASLPSSVTDIIIELLGHLNDIDVYFFLCQGVDGVEAVVFAGFPTGDRVKLKDLIETYGHMAGMIVQRTRAVDELRRSRLRFQVLIDNSPVGIMVINSQKVIVEINEAALNLLRRDRLSVVGRPCCDFICVPGEGKCPVFDLNEKLEQQEIMLYDIDRTAIPVLKSVSRIDMDGENFVIETFMDLRERKKEEHERLQLEKKLYQAQKLEGLGIMAAGIAHEVNTPIQYVGDNIRFVQDALVSLVDSVEKYKGLLLRVAQKYPEDNISGHVADIDDSVDIEFIQAELPSALSQAKEGIDRVAKIVNAMKDFSHVDDSEREAADINRSCDGACIITKNVWKYCASLEKDLQPDLPFVDCYLADINQLIINLIINAAHAIQDAKEIKSEKGKIRVSTRVDKKEVIISVSDNGTGIPCEVRDKVFAPFFTTKVVGRGTGQGLSMAYASVVDKHGGRIWFETETGVGTTFYIALPI